MGFGICLIANTLFLFELFGFDVVSFALFGYGLALLAESDKRFMRGAIFAGIGLIPSLVKLLNIFHVIDLTDNLIVNNIVIFLSSALQLLIYSVLFVGVKRIADSNDAKKLSRQSSVTLRISALILLLYVGANAYFSLVAPESKLFSTLTGIAIGLRYIMIIGVSVFLYNCFASITTPRLLQKEMKSDEKYEAKQQRKREKRERKEER